MHLQAHRGHFREYGTIPITCPNRPYSKPWAIAQAFCSKSVDFGTFGIQPKSFRNNPENTCKYIYKLTGGIWETLERFPTLAQIGPVQNHGRLPRVFGQNRWISDPSEFTPNLQEQSRKYLEIHFQTHSRHFREFGTIPSTYQNRPCSKPWAIAQAFCSKSVDFGPFGINPKSSGTISKVVGNPFART